MNVSRGGRGGRGRALGVLGWALVAAFMGGLAVRMGGRPVAGPEDVVRRSVEDESLLGQGSMEPPQALQSSRDSRNAVRVVDGASTDGTLRGGDLDEPEETSVRTRQDLLDAVEVAREELRVARELASTADARDMQLIDEELARSRNAIDAMLDDVRPKIESSRWRAVAADGSTPEPGPDTLRIRRGSLGRGDAEYVDLGREELPEIFAVRDRSESLRNDPVYRATTRLDELGIRFETLERSVRGR